jgi:hypothetical protein
VDTLHILARAQFKPQPPRCGQIDLDEAAGKHAAAVSKSRAERL